MFAKKFVLFILSILVGAILFGRSIVSNYDKPKRIPETTPQRAPLYTPMPTYDPYPGPEQ